MSTPAALPLPAGCSTRQELQPGDVDAVGSLVTANGNFSAAEIDIARELVQERLARGPASGYEFLLLHAADGQLAGYTCYGPIAGTVRRYDLYWIAVAPAFQGRGLGLWLLQRTEQLIAALGGEKIYIETSSRADYAAARALYQRGGYLLDAQLRDFYSPGDDNCIFARVIPRPE